MEKCIICGKLKSPEAFYKIKNNPNKCFKKCIDCILKIKYESYKRKNDPINKITKNLKGRMNYSFKRLGIKMPDNIESLLGIEIFKVKKHLERQFLKNMNWDNYGQNGWVIDHIVSLSLAKNEEELIRFCHYTNLRPLWFSENNKKKAKIIEHQLKLTI